ncbi:hypothetical protein PVAP13_7KG378755 [Panicum virgatum]|uniref:Uncharacterized protein n=1 Tax=Panicum virgatum TaxID=38727 RepID=A0A8T0QE42_PANVG|nr:hypothetical protein PVAP13_7KG378755 [Panicum virgatum]
MAARRRRPSLLADLPTELAIMIVGHIAATSATFHFLHCVCSDPKVGWLISVKQFYKLYRYIVPDGYLTLLPHLAQVGNLEACLVAGMIAILRYPLLRLLSVIDKNLERAARGGHKATAYVAAVLLYMASGGTGVDNTARQYMRHVVGDKPVKAPWGSAKMLSNEECYQIREKVTWLRFLLWMRRKAVVLPIRADVDPCKRVFCSEDCRIRFELNLFLGCI